MPQEDPRVPVTIFSFWADSMRRGEGEEGHGAASPNHGRRGCGE